MKKFKAALALLLVLALLCGCAAKESSNEGTEKTAAEVKTAVSATVDYANAKTVVLSSDGTATINGEKITSYDYTLCFDPSTVHDEVKNCPAWYYKGSEPDTSLAAYIATDIVYYPSLAESGFTTVNYDGENEYVYYYTDGKNNDYIFSTLPVLGNSIPTQMMHTAEEAAKNPVLHITEPGTYVLTGNWNGQILFDLGDEDDNFADESKKVTVVLNGVNINCSVAPGIIFDDCYECDNTWEDRTEYSGVVDTTNAGVTVVIADDSVNYVSGANVFRLLKTKYKDENSTDAVKVQKKAIKQDGAFYSYVSMNIAGEEKGTGKLEITSTTFEGLDCELHLTINSGDITIYSQDDGSNVNEDNVSVFTMNGGSLHIYAGLGDEGDGIDSNGYITINGGTLVSCANPRSDNGLDSEDGIAINGGTVVALGSSMGGSTYTVYVNGELQYGSAITQEGFGGGQGGPGGDFDPSQMGGQGGPGGQRPDNFTSGGAMTPPDGISGPTNTSGTGMTFPDERGGNKNANGNAKF